MRKDIEDLQKKKPPDAGNFTKAHGRQERRTIRASDQLKGYLDFPHVAQVFEIERVVHSANGTSRQEVCYGVTSLPTSRASGQRLLELNAVTRK